MKHPLLPISLLLFTLLTFPSCKSKDYIFHIRENTPSFFQNYDTTIVVLPLGEIVKHNISINKRSFDASKAKESDFIPVSGALQEKISQLDVNRYIKLLYQGLTEVISPSLYKYDSTMYLVEKLPVYRNFDSYLVFHKEELSEKDTTVYWNRSKGVRYYLINVKHDTLLSIVDIAFNEENRFIQNKRTTKRITSNLFKSTYESSCSEDDVLNDLSGASKRYTKMELQRIQYHTFFYIDERGRVMIKEN